jgi:RNA polymerase sigma-70 factor (ECF subfamily)
VNFPGLIHREASLAHYLYGVARNQVRRHLSAASFKFRLTTMGMKLLLRADHRTRRPAGDLTRREGLSALRQAILTLPLHYREVVALCDLEEMSYEEAARSIGCAVGTIRSRLHRAHALLVQKLRDTNETSSGVSRNSMRCFK